MDQKTEQDMMKSGVRITFHGSGDWVVTECEPQGKDTYVRVLGWYPSKEMALQDFPDSEVVNDPSSTPHVHSGPVAN